jgi:hypothetical protein
MIIQSFRSVYLAFFLAALVSTGFGQGPRFWRLWRISADPVSTSGHVVSLDCPNHGHVDYTFEIDGVSHAASDRFVDGINCSEMKVGQLVAVYYEKGTPRNNYGLYPAEIVGNRAMSALITGLIFFGGFILLGPLFLAGVWAAFSRLTERRG